MNEYTLHTVYEALKPGFHSNAIACIAFLAVFVYAT